MATGFPVETVWMGNPRSSSSGGTPIASATRARSCICPKVGSAWGISPNVRPPRSENRTGVIPTLSSSTTSFRGPAPRRTAAVPRVGWPAKGSSSRVVKILVRIPRERSTDGSRRRTNVVSERLNSRATASISASVSPDASGTTASGFPSSAWVVKTSTVANGNRRIGRVRAGALLPFSADPAGVAVPRPPAECGS